MVNNVQTFDAVVIGAGAAGMFCAAQMGLQGLSVALIDHAEVVGEKIRISGGGRCNFTNVNAGPANFLSQNPHFCRSALSRYTPQDFLDLMASYQIAWHEKHKGQLFCDRSSQDIVNMLVAECEQGEVTWLQPCKVEKMRQEEGGYALLTSMGDVKTRALVIATGGLSIPKIGATDLAWRIAKQFDIPRIEARPALVPLTFSEETWAPWVNLAGLSLEVDVCTATPPPKPNKPAGEIRFREDLLFTHRGLSGPAILQISSYWVAGEPGQPITINLLPELNVAQALLEAKAQSKKQLGTIISQWLPNRLAEHWIVSQGLQPEARLADLSDKILRQLGQSLNAWQIVPDGTEGYKKAEVTLGGVDTQALSSSTMMVKQAPGLFFIGEAVDVTGWLGGYNFQWAWSSGYAAAQGVNAWVAEQEVAAESL